MGIAMDFLKEKSKKVYVIIVVAMVVLVVGVTIGVISVESQRDRSVEISDMGVLSDVPLETMEHLKKNLFALAQNYFHLADNAVISDVIVRQNTYQQVIKRYSDGTVTKAKFLVDIDSLKQTYKITLYWSKTIEFTDTDVLIECSEESESKYPEATCYGGTYSYLIRKLI